MDTLFKFREAKKPYPIPRFIPIYLLCGSTPPPGNSTDCQEMCFLLAAADDDNFLIRNGCASLALTGGFRTRSLLSFIHKILIPTLSWIQTPSIVEVEPGEKTKTFTREPNNFFWQFCISAVKKKIDIRTDLKFLFCLYRVLFSATLIKWSVDLFPQS